MLERERHRVAVGLLVVCVVALAAVLVRPESVLRTAVDLTTGSAFFVVLLVLYVVRPFLAIPMSLLFVVTGWRYGVVVGLPIAVVGTVVTTFPPYYVGRYVRTDAGLLGRLCQSGERAFAATGDLRGMVASRLAPVPAEGVSYGAGAAGVAPSTYVLGTVVGELPWILGYLVIGRSMQELAFAAVEVDWRLLVVAGVVSVLVIGPAVVGSVRGVREG